jgi:hypothetical protein
LRKINAIVLLSAVIILVVHYTSTSNGGSDDWMYPNYQNGSQRFHKGKTSVEGFSMVHTNKDAEINVQQLHDDPTLISSNGIHQLVMEDVSHAVTSLNNSNSIYDVVNIDKSMHSGQKHPKFPNEKSQKLGKKNSSALANDSSTVTIYSTPKNKRSIGGNVIKTHTEPSSIDPGPGSSPTSSTSSLSIIDTFWTKVATVFSPVESNTSVDTVSNNEEYSDHGDKVLSESVPPPLASMETVSPKEDHYFASMLVDNLGFFFPFATTKNLNHPKQSGHAQKHPNKRPIWALERKQSLKDEAAVGEYYHSKGMALMHSIQNTNIDQSMGPSTCTDWNSMGLVTKLANIYIAIGNLIDEHYEHVFDPNNGSNGSDAHSQRSLSTVTQNDNDMEETPISGEAKPLFYTWQTDWKRGLELGRMFRELSKDIHDHCVTLDAVNNSETTAFAQDIANNYLEKSSFIDQFYNGDLLLGSSNHLSFQQDRDSIPILKRDDVKEQVQAKRIGAAIENYYKAIYDPDYKADMMALLPTNDPDKDFPSWGSAHDWRVEKAHGRAIDKYWAEYNYVMDKYYEKQGKELSKHYQQFYLDQYQKY